MTGPDGISGAIGDEIVIWERGADDAARMAAGVYDELAKLAAAGARAVVLVMGDEHGEPVLRNAERPWNPIDLPVLQIAPRDMVDFEPGTEAIVRIEGSREEVQARNVVAEIPGADPDAAPVTLMTPKSGWYTCAAERGGGIAVWLGVAERIAAGEQPRRTLRLVASSGHELHHLGLEAYIESLGDAASEVSAWIHLGAAIGARRGSPRFAASDDELMEVAGSALDAAGIVREPFPVGRSGYGEARNVAENRRAVHLDAGRAPLFPQPDGPVRQRGRPGAADAAHRRRRGDHPPAPRLTSAQPPCTAAGLNTLQAACTGAPCEGVSEVPHRHPRTGRLLPYSRDAEGSPAPPAEELSRSD